MLIKLDIKLLKKFVQNLIKNQGYLPAHQTRTQCNHQTYPPISH